MPGVWSETSVETDRALYVVFIFAHTRMLRGKLLPWNLSFTALTAHHRYPLKHVEYVYSMLPTSLSETVWTIAN